MSALRKNGNSLVRPNLTTIVCEPIVMSYRHDTHAYMRGMNVFKMFSFEIFRLFKDL